MSTDYLCNRSISREVPVQKALVHRRLFVIVEKKNNRFDHVITDRKKKNWGETKKLRSLFGEKEDVERREPLSTAALTKLKNKWEGDDKIKRGTNVKLYTAQVKSILTYNYGTRALTQTEEAKLDAFHRNSSNKA